MEAKNTGEHLAWDIFCVYKEWGMAAAAGMAVQYAKDKAPSAKARIKGALSFLTEWFGDDVEDFAKAMRKAKRAR